MSAAIFCESITVYTMVSKKPADILSLCMCTNNCKKLPVMARSVDGNY